MLVAMTGLQLVGVSGASSAGVITNPALAKAPFGRFTSTIEFDGGIVTVTPAPVNTPTLQGIGGMTAKIWATTQLAGFEHLTLGFGYVTIRGTARGEKAVNHVLAWVGFANGNTTGVCTKTSAGKFRTNGEAAVVVGDANFSQAVSYVPAGCGLTQRAGFRVPSEVASVPWVKASTASGHGLIQFRTTIPHCGSIEGNTRTLGNGAVEVRLYTVIPDWSAATCSANVVTLGVPIAKSVSAANATKLVHGPIGPVRQVVNAG
jgi:hypothetical protein